MQTTGRILRFISFSALGWLLWWLLSGRLTFLSLATGLLCATFAVYIGGRMAALDGERHPFRLNRQLLFGCAWLTVEIVKSNLNVARQILAPRLNISPNTVRIDYSPRTDLGRTILANAITLTPGTVTLDVSEQSMEVHVLTMAAAQSLQHGGIEQRLPDIGTTQ